MSERDYERLLAQRWQEFHKLAREHDRLKQQISRVRDIWQSRRRDPGVPGANPETGGDERASGPSARSEP